MPPRKRRTKAVSRAKPKAPSGDEGKDLSQEERRAKMELFLKDFDLQVKDRVAKMKAEARRNCQKIESLYRLELTKLPKHIRDMKRSEFLKLGGTISAVSMHEAEELVGTLSATIDSKLSCQRQRTVSKTANTCTTIEEEEEEGPTTKKKPTRRGKAVLGDASNMPPPPPPTTGRASRRATARTTQNQSYQTPFSRAGGKTTCDTPLFTPRFDPRLPNTPGTVLRKQRDGEKTVTSVVKYSLAGSPLAPTGPSMPDVFLPVGDGQMIALNEANVDEVMGHLDEQTKSTLEMVHKRLAAMFAK